MKRTTSTSIPPGHSWRPLFVASPSQPPLPIPPLPIPRDAAPQDEAADAQDLAHFFVAGAGGGPGRRTVPHLPAPAISTVSAHLRRLAADAPPALPARSRRRPGGGAPVPAPDALRQRDRPAPPSATTSTPCCSPPSSPSSPASRPTPSRRQGARGLMQVIPEVAAGLRHRGGSAGPRRSTWRWAAASSAACSRTTRGMSSARSPPTTRAREWWTATRGVPPYPETRGYVREVLAQYEEYHRKAGSSRRSR